MSKKKVLITDRFALDSLMWLQRQPSLEIMRSDHPSVLAQEQLVQAHALLIRSRTKIDEALLKKARQLQVIITCTSGFDHIDLAACTKWGITVMHTPTANIESAAQLTWALLLASAVRMSEARAHVEAEDWMRDRVIGWELSGRTHGIIGLGRIGSRVTRHAQAFGMSVVAYDPYAEDSVFEKLGVQRLSSLDELMLASDSVSVHVPKTLETDGMLHRGLFEKLQRSILFVNTSRGSVVSEKDLVEALEKGWIRAAGLDVFETEPLPKDSPLLKFKQVATTPHIGANTEEAFFKASQVAAEKLVAFFLNGSTSDTLPPRVPWYGATPNRLD